MHSLHLAYSFILGRVKSSLIRQCLNRKTTVPSPSTTLVNTAMFIYFKDFSPMCEHGVFAFCVVKRQTIIYIQSKNWIFVLLFNLKCMYYSYHFLTKYITNRLSSGEAKKKVIVKMPELKPSRNSPMPLRSMPEITLYILGQ